MKIAFIVNKTSGYEYEKIITAFSHSKIDYEIFLINKLSLDFSNKKNTIINKLQPFDAIISRTININNNQLSFNIRNSLINIYPDIKNKWLNGISYQKFPIFSKLEQINLFSYHDLPIPETYFNMEPTKTKLGYNFVLKGIIGSNGKSVHLIKSENDYLKYKQIYQNQGFIIQKKLPKAEDYRILVLGNQSLGFMKKISNSNFITNISQGGKATLAEKSRQDELSQLAIKAAAAAKCEFAGVDIMYDHNNQPTILEVNRAPGFQGFEKINNINVSEKIINYLIEKNS